MMGYTLPFTRESVEAELGGRELVHNRKIGNNLSFCESLQLPDERWRVDEGKLIIDDIRGVPAVTFNGLEVERDKVYLTGTDSRVAGRDARPQELLSEGEELGEDFHVVISSHVDYQEAVPRLIRSLKRAGIPKDRITVVEGGKASARVEYDTHTKMGVDENLFGLTGLIPFITHGTVVREGFVLLLHDTCEVLSDFSQRADFVDVGLPYDFIGSGWNEIGLWSATFLSELSLNSVDLFSVKPGEVLGMLMSCARMKCNGRQYQELRSKDVYGSGVERRVMESRDWGVKKFAGGKVTGGRP